MERLKSRLGWALAGALGLALVLVLARATVAGPLDPPGPVASTMRTLDELLPSWGRKLSSTGGCVSVRFACVLPTATAPTGEAVLDHETGLVWQRVPDTTSGANHWINQRFSCAGNYTGEREGWRLPTLQEMLSVRDVNTADFLPTGHPFVIGAPRTYWTDTRDDLAPNSYHVVTFNPSAGDGAFDSGGGLASAWCVRGGTQQVAPPASDAAAWSKTLAADTGSDACNSPRFTCVMSDQAVLDHETGLVWQRTPSAALDSWSNSLSRCDERPHAGRMGWRLPSSHELATLVDGSISSPNIALPPGNPFDLSGGGTAFWTTSKYGGGSAHEVVYFQSVNAGTVGFVYVYIENAATNRYWCVRGGTGEAPQ